jgi:hypothetical protein
MSPQRVFLNLQRHQDDIFLIFSVRQLLFFHSTCDGVVASHAKKDSSHEKGKKRAEKT